MSKNYYTQHGIGKSKYSVSYHDGKTTHPDGSPFYGIALFKNRAKEQDFVQKLITDGYTKL